MKACFACKHLREIVHTDELERSFCSQCYIPRDVLFAMNFMAATVPFKIGDRVECRTAGMIYDGVGTVVEISTEPKDGGTWVYPSFLVEFEDKVRKDLPDRQLYTEIGLTKVDKKVKAND